MNTKRTKFEVGQIVVAIMNTTTLVADTVYKIVDRFEEDSVDGIFYTYTAVDSNGHRVAVKNAHILFKLSKVSA